MTPSHSPEPLPPPPDLPTPPALRLAPEDSARDALRELSDAADRYATRDRAGRHRRSRRNLWIPILTGLITGGILFAYEKPEHACVAEFRIPAETTPSRRAFLRRELLDTAWNRFADRSSETWIRNWSIIVPGDERFRLVLRATDPDPAVEALRSLASSYLARLKTVARSTRETPSEAESVLTDYLDGLRTRLTEAQNEVDSAVAAIPAGDPSPRRTELRETWRRLRSEFDATRQELSTAAGTLQRVRAEPDPVSGMVTASEREAAIAADPALVADLDELRLRLSELRQHVLTVFEASATPLNTLHAATEELFRLTAPGNRPGGSEALATPLAALLSTLAEYQDGLREFSTDWSHERARMDAASPEPREFEIQRSHAQARERLNQFLFASGKRLTSLRSSVDRISESVSDTPRFHVFHSDLVRGFQVLQTAHHRFEFASSRIEGAENFRLDAASRSALGLRRRTQEALEGIESRLQKEAVDRARLSRQHEVNAATLAVERVRNATDAAIEELVSLQDAINLSDDLSEEFHRAMVRLEAATNRLLATQSNLRGIEGKVGELQARRRTDRTDPLPELIFADVLDRSVNLPARARLGGLTAGVTGALAFVLQWMFARRTNLRAGHSGRSASARPSTE